MLDNMFLFCPSICTNIEHKMHRITGMKKVMTAAPLSLRVKFPMIWSNSGHWVEADNFCIGRSVRL